MLRKAGFLLIFGICSLTSLLAFEETPVGEEQYMKHMKIAGVYFQSVYMVPADKAGLEQKKADIHLEADIHAEKNNPYGFSFGDWIPFLQVKFNLVNLDNKKKVSGTLLPMSASDGPHYGLNIKMPGYGRYKLTFTIGAPSRNGYLQHMDKETGVKKKFWRKPFKVSWNFRYKGL